MHPYREVVMKKLIASCVVVAGFISAPAFAAATVEANTLAYQAIQDGKWAEAESLLRSGLAQNPDDPMRLLNLAYVLQSTGRQSEAMTVYEKVLKLDRDPLVAVGSDSKVKPARAKLIAKKGVAAIAGAK
jgi:Tfp pilus assembly protein PilF